MKKILSQGSKVIKVYRTKCMYCDCEFEYQGSDIYQLVPNSSLLVRCPECGSQLYHKDSISTTTRVATESL